MCRGFVKAFKNCASLSCNCTQINPTHRITRNPYVRGFPPTHQTNVYKLVRAYVRFVIGAALLSKFAYIASKNMNLRWKHCMQNTKIRPALNCARVGIHAAAAAVAIVGELIDFAFGSRRGCCHGCTHYMERAAPASSRGHRSFGHCRIRRVCVYRHTHSGDDGEFANRALVCVRRRENYTTWRRLMGREREKGVCFGNERETVFAVLTG